jgi:DNA segregation ATPase FtsK/SpoIIIE, S-DNA-T family
VTPDQNAVISTLTLKMTQLGLVVKPVNEVTVGPVVSVYRFIPQGATKISNIEALSQDFALTLGVEDTVVKRVPGEVAVSIFVPNKERKYVMWRDICQVGTNGQRPLIPLLLGIDHLGHKIIEDLTLFPHLLIAGSTGGGKSTWLGSVIATIIYNYSPQEIKLVLSDTKGVEFNHFEGAPHLLLPTATTVQQTQNRFDVLLDMMEKRLRDFGKQGHRNILEYNNAHQQNRLPYICLLIDELADLLGDKRKPEDGRGPSSGEVSRGKISRLAAKARATGIHIIAATQRPSVKLIEGDIKANFLGRLTFRLPSEADSRTVLGCSGAEHLLSRGDMLFINPNRPGIYRIHAPIASIEDITACVEFATRR